MFFRGLLVDDPPEFQVLLNVKNFGKFFVLHQPAGLDARRRSTLSAAASVNPPSGNRAEVAGRRADTVRLLKFNQRRLGGRAEVGRLVARRTRAAGRDYVPGLIKILLKLIHVLPLVSQLQVPVELESAA